MTRQEQRKNLWSWADALESGKYKQCTSFMVAEIHSKGNVCGHDDGVDWGYCCLGVAEAVKNPSMGPEDLSKYIFNGKTETSKLAQETLDYFGLTPEMTNILESANDNGVSFKTISKIVRSHASTLISER